jgi:hypothetical protein
LFGLEAKTKIAIELSFYCILAKTLRNG